MGTIIIGPAVQSERGSPQGAVLWALDPCRLQCMDHWEPGGSIALDTCFT